MPSIDPEFQELIPEPTPEEKRMLEESIKTEGCREALIIWQGLLLDGHNRFEICRRIGIDYKIQEIDLPDREAAKAWIEKNQLGRRNLTPDWFRYLLGRMYNRQKKPEHAGENQYTAGGEGQNDTQQPTAETIAENHGVSERTVKRAGQFAEEVDNTPELKQALTENKSVKKAKKESQQKQKQEEQSKAQAEIAEAKERDLTGICYFRVSSCRELFNDGIEPDVIITDPPYPKEYLDCYSELAECAAEAQVKVVAVMTGQTYLPEVMRRMCQHLKYRWTIAYMTPGGQAVQQWQAKVNTFWKPVLLFGEAVDWFGDVAKSDVNANEKENHHWGQSESGIADLVKRLSNPKDLICDPFVGGGTTAVVSLDLGRRFVGCDADEESIERAMKRVKECNNGKQKEQDGATPN